MLLFIGYSENGYMTLNSILGDAYVILLVPFFSDTICNSSTLVAHCLDGELAVFQCQPVDETWL